MQSCLHFSKLGQSILHKTLTTSRSQSARNLKFRHVSQGIRYESTTTVIKSADAEGSSDSTKSTKTTKPAVLKTQKPVSKAAKPISKYGKVRRKFALTPNQALGTYLDIKDDSERSAYWKRIRFRLPWDSLPVKLIHHIHTARLEQNNLDDWDEKIRTVTAKWLWRRGIPYTDVISWADAVLEEDADRGIQKLLSTSSNYPSFLLLVICRKDIYQVDSLKAVFRQVWDRILPKAAPISSTSNSGHPISAALSPIPQDGFEQAAFSSLWKRLLYHCRRIWPSAVVTVTHMVTSYIDTLQSDDEYGVKVLEPAMHRRICAIQNKLLEELALPAFIEPYLSMEYNWSAQKVVLGFSSKFDPPLTLDQHAYHAVIQVLTASKKSPSEYRSSMLRARTWPPWRIDQDGMDAQREVDDDISRSIAALMRKRESGYSDAPRDQVLSILGGQESDGTPTIQTRFITSSPYYTPNREGDNHPKTLVARVQALDPNIWAARVRATRDVQEAWGAFAAFMKQGGTPNLSMYLAMFQKLAYEDKRLATEEEAFRAPGDGLEVFAVPDDNISEYYRSSLQPPSAKELYSRMMQSGQLPSGACLSFLVCRARTIVDALRFLIDSGLSERALQYLHGGHPQDLPSSKTRFEVQDNWSKVVPSRITNDFIIMLCRFGRHAVKVPTREPKHSHVELHNESDMIWELRDARKEHRHPIYRRPLPHAAYLLRVSGTRERIAWYALWRSLAQRNVVLLPNVPGDPKNWATAWHIAARSFRAFLDLGLELDPHGFIYLCEIFIKYARIHSAIQDTLDHVREATDIIKTEFKRLIVCNEDSEYPFPRFKYPIHGVHLHAFLRSMAAVGDHAEILTMLEWIVLNLTEVEAVSSRSANGEKLLRRTLIGIRVSCEGTSFEEKARTLIESVESWDGWPTDWEVAEYRASYEPNHVDDNLAEYSNNATLEETTEQHDEETKEEHALKIEDVTDNFFQQELVINRYLRGG